MARFKIFVSLIILSTLASPIFAGGLSLEITNNMNSSYVTNLLTTTNYPKGVRLAYLHF